MTADLRFRHLAARAWRAFRARPWPLVHAHLAYLVFSLAFALPELLASLHALRGGSPPPSFAAMNIAAGLTALLLGMPLLFGLLLLSLQAVRGQQTAWGQLFAGFGRYWKTMTTGIMFFVVTALGFLLLVVPGILLMVSRWPVFLLTMDSDLGPWERFRRAKELTRGRRWRIFADYALLYLLMSLIYIPLQWGMMHALEGRHVNPQLFLGLWGALMLLSVPAYMAMNLFHAAMYDELSTAARHAPPSDPHQEFELA